MKNILYPLFLAICCLFGGYSSAQESGVDSTGFPGDNFSLQGTLQLFKDASSPEEFEKLLNTESNHVNNLDLNGDGDIDYIRVVDQADQEAHAFVLQVPVSEDESQDEISPGYYIFNVTKNGKPDGFGKIVKK